MIPIPLIVAAVVGYRVGKGKLIPDFGIRIGVKDKEKSKPPAFTVAQLSRIVEPGPAGRRFRANVAAGLNKRFDLCSLESVDGAPDGVLLYRVIPLGAETANDVIKRAREVGALVFASLSCLLQDAEKLVAISAPELAAKLLKSPNFAILLAPPTQAARAQNGARKPVDPPGPPANGAKEEVIQEEGGK